MGLSCAVGPAGAIAEDSATVFPFVCSAVTTADGATVVVKCPAAVVAVDVWADAAKGASVVAVDVWADAAKGASVGVEDAVAMALRVGGMLGAIDARATVNGGVGSGSSSQANRMELRRITPFRSFSMIASPGLNGTATT